MDGLRQSLGPKKLPVLMKCPKQEVGYEALYSESYKIKQSYWIFWESICKIKGLNCTCFQGVISSWSSGCRPCFPIKPCPIELVTWILRPWTEVNFKIAIKFPFGWCSWWSSCNWCSRGKSWYSIVWKSYTCTNCKSDVIDGYIALVTTSSDTLKHNLTQENLYKDTK